MNRKQEIAISNLIEDSVYNLTVKLAEIAGEYDFKNVKELATVVLQESIRALKNGDFIKVNVEIYQDVENLDNPDEETPNPGGKEPL